MSNESEISIQKRTIRANALDTAKGLIEKHNLKVAKINRKFGMDIARAVLTAGKPYTMKGMNHKTMKEVERVVVDVEISGQLAIVSGWEISAILSLIDDGYGVSHVSGIEMETLMAMRERGGECDHCKTKRARSTTYVLRNRGVAETGRGGPEIRLVGSACLKDFTGHASPQSLVAYAEYLSGLDRELDEMKESFGSVGQGTEIVLTLARFLGFVRCAIREGGWLSKTKSNEVGGEPTSKIVWRSLEAYENIARLADTDVPERDGVSEKLNPEFQAAKDALKPTAADMASGESDALYVEEKLSEKNDGPESLDDYEMNVLFAIRQGIVFRRNSGICASICAMADRLRRPRLDGRDEWMGAVGQRSEFIVTVKFLFDYESEFGRGNIFSMSDAEGRRCKWFTTSRLSEKMSNYECKGRMFRIKATVKKHEIYKERRETLLTRCKLIEEITPEQQVLPF